MSAGRRMKLGRAGEQRAVQMLTERGLTILDRNWRNGSRGELDIIARDPHTAQTVIVEVRTRVGALFGTGLESVDSRKYSRLRGLAYAWCRRHKNASHNLRIDVIALTVPWSDTVRRSTVEELIESAHIKWVQAVLP